MNDPSGADPSSVEALLGKVVDEYLGRLHRGERPTVEDYARRFPEIAGVLRDVLPALHGAQPPDAAGDSSPGAVAPEATLGDYRIVRELGRGGMGVVYEAVQLSLGRRVALKVLPFAAALDPRRLQRFKNEALAVAHLDHPHVVDVYGVGCERGVHFYVMRLIDGKSLAEVVAELRHLSGLEAFPASVSFAAARPAHPAAETQPARGTVATTARPGLDYLRSVAALGAQVADALEHAHREGVVHRDIKPSNLLLDSRGKVWVTDFGLARVEVGGHLTLTGDLVGTLRYMSPEQAEGRAGVDHRTDIYSVGATLYELLTLEPAFAGDARGELLRRIAAEEPKPPRAVDRSIPAELETVVLKAMEKSPADRYATAGELADDLRRFLADEPVRARRPGLGQRLRRWARRHGALACSTGIVLLISSLVLAGSAGWVLREGAARRAVTAAEVRQTLREVERLEGQSRWGEAQAVARHARSLLTSGGDEGSLAAEVQGHLADLALLNRIETIRDRHAELDLKNRDIGSRRAPGGYAEANLRKSEFESRRVLPEYAEAFAGWGLPTAAADDAVRRLAGRPDRVRDGLLAALHDWYWVAAEHRRPEAEWLGRLLARADNDPWRRGAREAAAGGDLTALKRLADAADVTAHPPGLLAHVGRHLCLRGEVAAGVALLGRAQWQHPRDFLIARILGDAYQDADPPRPEKSARYYLAAAAARPGPGVYVSLGNSLESKGEPDAALAAFQKAVALEPNYAEAHYHLGRVREGLGEPDAAVTHFKDSIRLKADLAPAHRRLVGALGRRSRLDEVLALYAELLRGNPDAGRGYYHLGDALRAAGRLDDAVTAYREALERNQAHPVFPDPVDYGFGFVELNDLGWSLCAQGGPPLRDPGRARGLAAAALRASGDDPEVVFQHAGWLLLTGDRYGYRRECARSLASLSQAPDPLRGAYLVARMCTLDVEPAVPAEQLEPVARRAANAAAHHRHTLGMVAYRAGRFDEAIAQFRQSMDWDPAWPGAVTNWLGMALAQHRAGRLDEAGRWMEKARAALARHPSLPDRRMHSHDWIACRLLAREAEEVFGEAKGTGRP